ncbi:hypothetical protein ACA910_001721 [Epithemia clementina (nom. ined.)]
MSKWLLISIQRILAVIYAIDSITEAAGGPAFRFICTPEPEILTLYKDVETGNYVVENEGTGTRKLRTVEHLPHYTLLRGEESDDEHASMQWEKPFSVIQVSDEEEEGEKARQRRMSGETTQARICTCGPFRTSNYRWEGEETVYCPLTTTNCGTYRSPEFHELRVGCLTPPKNEKLHDAMILVAFIWSICMAYFLFSHRRLRHIINLCVSKCFPGYLQFLANRMMRTEPEVAREMMRRNIHVRLRLMQQRLEAVAPELANEFARQRNAIDPEQAKPPPRSLALKTRIYRKHPDKEVATEGVGASVASWSSGLLLAKTTTNKPEEKPGSSSNDEEEDCEHCCIICFQDIEDGERVGALPCTHVFHVECLKVWLKRRNACPMCNRNDVAEPRHDEPEESASTTTAASINESSATSADGEPQEGTPDTTSVDGESQEGTPDTTNDSDMEQQQ